MGLKRVLKKNPQNQKESPEVERVKPTVAPCPPRAIASCPRPSPFAPGRPRVSPAVAAHPPGRRGRAPGVEAKGQRTKAPPSPSTPTGQQRRNQRRLKEPITHPSSPTPFRHLRLTPGNPPAPPRTSPPPTPHSSHLPPTQPFHLTLLPTTIKGN